MKKKIIILLAWLSMSLPLSADIYFKTITRIDPIDAFGQKIPAREIISEQWIADDFYYLFSGGGLSYLYDLKNNIIYLISHQTKSYLEMKPPVDFASLLPPELAPLAQALEKMTISVTPTGQSKMINNINCQGYRLEMTMMMYPVEMSIWASEELPVNLKNFLGRVWPEIMKLELKSPKQAISEISKIKGLWIYYETKAQMMGMEVASRTELVELSKKAPPRGIYVLPEGYRKKDRLEMEDIQTF